MSRVLGIDPGLEGAFALYDTDRPNDLLMVEDMPVVKRTVGKMQRPRLDMPKLEETIASYCDEHKVDLVTIEDPGTRPRQSGTMAFGFGLGAVHAFMFAKRLRVEIVVPTKWKKTLRVPKDKKEATYRAEELFPACRNLFRGPKGGTLDGRAEAAMIALYGAQTFL